MADVTMPRPGPCRHAAVAVQNARSISGQISTLILPADASWDPGGIIADSLPVPVPPPIDLHAVENVARGLRSSERDGSRGGPSHHDDGVCGPHAAELQAEGSLLIDLIIRGTNTHSRMLTGWHQPCVRVSAAIDWLRPSGKPIKCLGVPNAGKETVLH